jgi:hypothetical protein
MGLLTGISTTNTESAILSQINEINPPRIVDIVVDFVIDLKPTEWWHNKQRASR